MFLHALTASERDRNFRVYSDRMRFHVNVPTSFAQKLESRMNTHRSERKEDKIPVDIQALAMLRKTCSLKKKLQHVIFESEALSKQLEITTALLKWEVQLETFNSESAQGALWNMCAVVNSSKNQNRIDQAEICRLHEELDKEEQKSSAVLLASQSQYHAFHVRTSRHEQELANLEQKLNDEISNTHDQADKHAADCALLTREIALARERETVNQSSILDARAKINSLQQALTEETLLREQYQESQITMKKTLDEKMKHIDILTHQTTNQSIQLAESTSKENEQQRNLAEAEKNVEILTQRCSNLEFTITANAMSCMGSEDDLIQLEEEVKIAKRDRDDALSRLDSVIAHERRSPIAVMLEIISEMEYVLREKTEQAMYFHSDLRRAASIRTWGEAVDGGWEARLSALKARVMGEKQRGLQDRFDDGDLAGDAEDGTYGEGKSFEMVVR